MKVRKFQLGSDRAAQRTATGNRTKSPEPVTCVVNKRHPKIVRGSSELDEGRVDGAERHAALASAQSLRLREPTGDALELVDRNARAREDHSALR